MSSLILYIYKAALNILYFSGLYKLAASITRGRGVIFTLHQVSDQPLDEFSPNSILTVTPDFLEQTIKTVLEEGYEIISLKEMTEREEGGAGQKPFAVFTFDDGYVDNKDVALKIFEKYDIPLAIYVVSEYSSHQGELWWLALEEIIRQNDSVKNPYMEGQVLPTRTTAQKYRAFDKIYWPMRHSNQHHQRITIRSMAEENDYDIDQLTRNLIMDWDQLKEINNSPLVTLGAHTKSHFALSRLTSAEAKSQVIEGLLKMEKELGEQAEHFSYPYGSRQCAGPRDFDLLKNLGMKTAVTTRKGVIYNAHDDHQTALPRVSLNGDYQHQKYLKVFMSGLPFRLYNFWNRLDVK